MHQIFRGSAWLLCVLAVLAPAAADISAEQWAALAAYRPGERRDALLAIEREVTSAMATPAQRAALAAKLGALLATGTSYDAKAFCCRQLAICGTAAQVPALAELLANDKLSFYSRHALERIADPAAGEALRRAMTSLTGPQLAGVATSLGARRDQQAIAGLAKLLEHPDVSIATAAAAALGRIGTAEAAGRLEKKLNYPDERFGPVVIDNYLRCADQMLKEGTRAEAIEIYRQLSAAEMAPHVRVAAIQGLLTADSASGTAAALAVVLKESSPAAHGVIGLLRQVRGDSVSEQICKALPKANPAAQVRLLSVLESRRDPDTRAAVTAMLKSADPGVSEAAARALGSIGDARDVALLLPLLGESRLAAAAHQSLEKLRDPQADHAIVSALGSNQDAAVQKQLIEALAARRAASAVPLLLKLAGGEGPESVRLAAIHALGACAGEGDVQAVAGLLIEANLPAAREAVLKSLASLAARMRDPDRCISPIEAAMERCDAAGKAALLQTLGRIGGDRALATVKKAAVTTEPEVKDAALRAIAQWPDASGLRDMMELVRVPDAKLKILALRGITALLQKPQAVAADKALDVGRQMLQACSRPEEKRVALGAIGNIKDPRALDLALPLLGDESLKNEAASAVIQIVRKMGRAKDPGKAALERVLSSSASDTIKKQAEEMLKTGK